MSPLPRHPSLSPLAASFLAALLATLILGSGCASAPHSPEAAEDRAALSPRNQEYARGTLAAVEIRGQSFATVRETIQSVFEDAHFTPGKHDPELLVFEKPAPRGLVASYGNWGGIAVNIRLKVEITPQNSGAYLLRCRSYIVREPGTGAESEQPLARRHVREYEGLLHEVSTRLN